MKIKHSQGSCVTAQQALDQHSCFRLNGHTYAFLTKTKSQYTELEIERGYLPAFNLKSQTLIGVKSETLVDLVDVEVQVKPKGSEFDEVCKRATRHMQAFDGQDFDNLTSSTMTPEDAQKVLAHLERQRFLQDVSEKAKQAMASWPEWERAAARDALNNSPTRKTPRTPVVNDDDSCY